MRKKNILYIACTCLTPFLGSYVAFGEETVTFDNMNQEFIIWYDPVVQHIVGPSVSPPSDQSTNNITVNFDTAINNNPYWIAGGLVGYNVAQHTVDNPIDGNIVTINKTSKDKIAYVFGARVNNDLINNIQYKYGATNNTVKIDGTEGHANFNFIYGAYVEGDVSKEIIGSNNEVNINHPGIEVSEGIYGFYWNNTSSVQNTLKQYIEKNSVTLTLGKVNDIFGAYSNASTDSGAGRYLENNSATIYGGTAKNVYGAYSVNDTVDNNSATMNSGEAESIYGGYSENGTVKNNSVAINGGVAENVYGSYSLNSSVDGNNVTVNGGIVDSVYGGMGHTASTNNTVIVNSKVNNLVAGGYVSSANGIVENNNIEIHSGAELETADIFPAHSNSSNNFNNNTVKFMSYSGSIQSIQNHQNIIFNNVPNVALTEFAVIVNNSVELDNVKIEVKSLAYDGPQLLVGQKLMLIDNVRNADQATIVANNVESASGSHLYLFELDQNYTDQLVLRLVDFAVVTFDRLKSLAEGQLAGAALLDQGSEKISGIMQGLVKDQEKIVDSSWRFFSRVSGGQSRYITGSHIDLRSATVVSGLSRYQNGLLLGAFAEAGWGSYTSFNRFSNWNDVHGGGDTHYVGGGVLARYDWRRGFYIDGALRVGQVETDFSSQDISFVSKMLGYRTQAMYHGAQFALGHQIYFHQNWTLDLSSRYRWTHQAGNEVSLEGFDSPINLSAINTQKLRSTAQLSYQRNGFSPYISVGYEREFDGIARTKYGNQNVEPSSLHGHTGVGGLGFNLKHGDSLVVHAGVQGYIGKRQGYGAVASLQWRF